MDAGLRSAELIGLTLADVDLDNGLLLVLGKGRRKRQVPIGKKCISAIDKYLRSRSKSDNSNRHELWIGSKGPLTDSGLRQMLTRKSRSAGIPHIHAHQLRRYFAAEWISEGGSETDLMRITGWKTRAMINHYTSGRATQMAFKAHRRLSPADRL